MGLVLALCEINSKFLVMWYKSYISVVANGSNMFCLRNFLYIADQD